MTEDDKKFSRVWKDLVGRKEFQPSSEESGEKPGASPRGGVERRKMPRVRVLSALQGYGVDVESNVVVRDVSLGGFAVESPIPFRIGDEHTFLFSTADGRETIVRCECKHARASQAGGTQTCIAGFQFLPGQQDSLQIIIEVYQRLRERQREK